MKRLRRWALRAAIQTDWIARLASRDRLNGKDSALDPQIATALEYQRRARLPALESMAPAIARKLAESNNVAALDPEPMATITDTTVSHARIPVRIYEPLDTSKNWLVWYHGGGGVIGSIDGTDRIARYFAQHTKCTVASVGYRLGPEHKHPTAIEDACLAWDALIARMPTDTRTAVGGESFGGFLAVHVDRDTRNRRVRRPDLQVLVCPALDLTLNQPSMNEFAEGYLLTKSMMQYFCHHYLNDHDDEQACSPLFWPDVADASPAIVATAHFDPLGDDGNVWASRLAASGVLVRHQHHESLVHGFLSLAGIVRAAKLATDQICAEIVELLGK